MILRAEGETWCGAVVDLRNRAVDPAALAAAIRGEDSPYAVRCRSPGPLHQHAGLVVPGMTLSERPTLAAAARSRGFSAPQDDERARLRDRLAAFETPPAPPRRDPPPGEEVARLRERVAELRGRVRAIEDRGGDPADARARLREAAARLSELETERAAADQRREHVRTLRDRREERFGLEDRLANLDRAARAHLADAVRDPYRVALAALDPTVEAADADPASAALAALRIGRVRAPVVLAVDRFPSPAAAAAWIGGPVAVV